MLTKNEELRTKNWDCFGVALQSSTLAGESESFMSNHKVIGNTCEGIGFARVSGANRKCCSCGDYGNAAIHSSFFVLNS